MDYIRFVNSRDIREYLYEIDYKLSGEQKLFLVDKCYRIPLEEKLEAMKLLLDAPDEDVTIRHPSFFKKQPKDGDKNEFESLHELTKGIIENYSVLIELLKAKEPECYYEVRILEKDRTEFYSFASFPSFEDALNGYLEEYSSEDREYVSVVQFSKNYLLGFQKKNRRRKSDGKYIRAFFDSDLKLMHIYDNECLPQERFYYTTDKLFIYLPMPFKAGDILVNSKDCVYAGVTHGFNCDYELGSPFVVESFNPDERLLKGIDCSDISCYCFYFDNLNQYHLVSEVNVHNYDLEYYRKPLKDKERFLRIFSLRLKDKFSVSDEEMLIAFEYCKNLEIQKHLKKQLQWVNSSMSYYLADGYWKNEEDYFRRLDKEKRKALTDSVKIWLDDERDAPDGYEHCHSVNEAISKIKFYEKHSVAIEELNLDHDLGDYAKEGGDAIKLIDWLCMRETFYKIELHTANPVGRANMQRTIDRYWPHDEEDE
ncbi:cyclic-phosphate processing receiver domain-containing protein [Succinivibrio dextrinosolvens]|uniref:cyclic-phosphate processing receiver domain-containing protein n=1 Tax=Succinivibrio dextrinosolvens TaxID=83771 RepID=UPI00241E0FA0|nr:cyclic-phosphate processing receiver domain-containing protein [Succinivibrio dextrinosolvens]MBE6424194.1 hypothetical protein [Succinivibrio dextrinosolvens]